MSSVSPAVFVDGAGEVRLVAGGSGGAGVASAVAWVALHHLWLGHPLQQAVDDPRLHYQLHPTTLVYEQGLSPVSVLLQYCLEEFREMLVFIY